MGKRARMCPTVNTTIYNTRVKMTSRDKLQGEGPKKREVARGRRQVVNALTLVGTPHKIELDG